MDIEWVEPSGNCVSDEIGVTSATGFSGIFGWIPLIASQWAWYVISYGISGNGSFNKSSILSSLSIGTK